MHFSRWWGSFHLLTVFFLNSLFRPCPFDQDCCPFTKQTVYRWALDTHNCIILFFLCVFAGDNTFPWNALNMTGRWDYTEGLSWRTAHFNLTWYNSEFKSKENASLACFPTFPMHCLSQWCHQGFPSEGMVFHLSENIWFFYILYLISKKSSLISDSHTMDFLSLLSVNFHSFPSPCVLGCPCWVFTSHTPTQAKIRCLKACFSLLTVEMSSNLS